MPASCVTVQIGQCGTQLGACVLDRLNAEARHEADAQYFFRQGKSGERVARAVLVDTEPRVVGEVEGGDRDVALSIRQDHTVQGPYLRVVVGKAAVEGAS